MNTETGYRVYRQHEIWYNPQTPKSIKSYHPFHPGAASALPTSTLRAPPLPAGGLGGALVTAAFPEDSGLVVLATFAWGAIPGDTLRVDFPLFSFSREPLALLLPAAGGPPGCGCPFNLDIDFLSAELFCIPSLETTLRSAFFSLNGLSSSSSIPLCNRFASAASASPSVCRGLDSGLSEELASIRMRLSGLGFAGE